MPFEGGPLGLHIDNWAASGEMNNHIFSFAEYDAVQTVCTGVLVCRQVSWLHLPMLYAVPDTDIFANPVRGNSASDLPINLLSMTQVIGAPRCLDR